MRPYYPDHFAGREKKAVTTIQPPEADIPQLKEKEKERKAGGAWVAGSGGGPSGTLLGSGLGRPGVLGSARFAAALSRMFGGTGTFLGGLFASSAGSSLVLAGMILSSGLLAAAAIRLLAPQALRSPESQAFLPPSFAGLAGSTIVIDRPGDQSLGYLANANEGEILWDKAQGQREAPAEAEPPEEQKAPDAPPVPEPPKFEVPNVEQMMAKAGLKADAFMKGMSNKGSSSAFGLGGDRLRDGLAGFSLKKSFAPKLGSTAAGKAAALQRSKLALKAGARRVQSGKSGRAMGQLKLARNMSAFGAKAPTDAAARQYTTDAFEQGRNIGGALQGVDNGSGVVVPPGNGADAPGVTDTAPDVPPGMNVTPYQGNVDAAKQQGKGSAAMKNLGMMLLAIGAVLMAIGMALMGNPFTMPIGIALMMAGLALMILGAMLIGMSQQQGQGAKDQGNKVAQADGQKDQGANVNECADQAMNGTDPEACRTSRGPGYYNEKLTNTVHADVERERNAGYTLEDPAVR